MTTSLKRLSIVIASVVFFLGNSSAAWAVTLTGLASEYPICAKDGKKPDSKNGSQGEEEEPDCEE